MLSSICGDVDVVFVVVDGAVPVAGTRGTDLGGVQIIRGGSVQASSALSLQGQMVSTASLQSSIQSQHAIQ